MIGMPGATARRSAERRAHLMRELVEIILFVGIVFLAISVTQSYAPSDVSMQPELNQDQHVLVNKAAYILWGPARGEVVLVANPTAPQQLMMRRVIAVPGDTIEVNTTQVIVNGVNLDEHAYTGIAQGQSESPVLFPKTTMGPNQYFVMADNRFSVSGSASDSRYFGPVSRSNIIGRAELVYWPLKDFHWINTYGGVYQNIPNR